jgi:glycerophosphoryl diester phosphodiesterase
MLGAHAIELDVHATRDGRIVVHHDRTLHTGRRWPRRIIGRMTDAELGGYPLAAGVAIPSLDAVLAAIPAPSVLYIEIKAPHIEAAVVDCVRRADAVDRCAIHSADHGVARRVRALLPALATGILVPHRLADPAGALRSAGARDYWARWEHVTQDLVAAIHAAGGQIIAWTVNTVTDARRLAAWGIDGLCTDTCDELAAAVGASPNPGLESRGR